jgi:hypothetical protein
MRIKQAIAAAAISFGALFVVSAILPPSASAFQDPAGLGPLRGLVDRTQSDLRNALALEPEGPKQHERYRDAQKALSEFDKHLAKGHFDRGKLNESIDRVKSILDHNTLQATSRDSLMHDQEDLRIARDRFSH